MSKCVSTEVVSRRGEVKIRVRREGRWGYSLFTLEEFRDLAAIAADTLEHAEELERLEERKRQLSHD